MSLNCSDRATKEDLYGLLFSPEILIRNLACEDFSSKRLSRQMVIRALCSKKVSRQTASLFPWRIKGVCHSAPLSIDCFLLSCFFFSSLDGRKEGKRRSRRLRPPAKFAGYMMDSICLPANFAGYMMGSICLAAKFAGCMMDSICPPANFAVCVMVCMMTFIGNRFFVFTSSFFTSINAICKGDG